MKSDIAWKKAVKAVLLRRIKYIGDNDQLYTGYPAQIIREITQMQNRIKTEARRRYKAEWIRKKRSA